MARASQAGDCITATWVLSPPSLHDQLSRSLYQPAVAVRGDQQCNLGRQPDYFSSGFSQRRAGSGERDEHINVLIELLESVGVVSLEIYLESNCDYSQQQIDNISK